MAQNFVLTALRWVLFLLLAFVGNMAQAELEQPHFSHSSGFYAQPFELQLDHPDDVTIYYTLDGSEPDPDNLNGRTYRYKNNYQQPPLVAGQPIDIAPDFLHHEYQTWRYEAPIFIDDRSADADRISAIATTDAQIPTYFPKPEPSDHWLNRYVDYGNQLIVQLNRGVSNLNRLLNKVVRNYKRWRSGESQPTGQIPFVRPLPQLPYWEYAHRNNYKGTPVRAMAVKHVDGQTEQSPIATHTYFIGDSEDFLAPHIFITAPEQDLYAYDGGIFVAGKGYDDWLAAGVEKREHSRQIPYEWNNGKTPQAHIELPHASKTAEVRLKTHGGTSRGYPSKSIRIYPGKQNSPLPIFDDENPILNNRIILRNAGNDWSQGVFLDGVFQQLLQGLHFSTQRYRPYTVFINGEYHGILNARDRFDSRFLTALFDLPSRKEVELIKTGLQPDENGDLQRVNTAQHGSIDALEALNHSTDTEQIIQAIDWDSLQDYFSSQFYLGNNDWPDNNYRLWRYLGSADDDIPLTDGKWRWLMYDIDAVGGAELDPKFNALHRAQRKKDSQNYHFFHQLMADPTYQQQFITRFADLLNTTFAPDRVSSSIRQAEEHLAKEMPQHIRRWGTPRTMDYWHDHVEKAIQFAQQRPAEQRQQLQDYFDLSAPYELSLDVVLEDKKGRTQPAHKAATIQLNTLTLGINDHELTQPAAASAPAIDMEKYLALPWQGEYFAGMPIRLDITPREGYQFSHWEGDGITAEIAQQHHIELHPEKNTALTAVLKKST